LLSVPYALYANTTRIPVSNVQTDQQNRSVSTSWNLGPTFNTINGFTAGSLVKISYLIPIRNVGSPQTLDIEPQISFDGGTNWNSLRSGRQSINNGYFGSYTNTLLIDPQQTSDFSVSMRFYYYSNSSGIFINQGASGSVSGTAPVVMSGTNGLQHFTKVIVEEVFQ